MPVPLCAHGWHVPPASCAPLGAAPSVEQIQKAVEWCTRERAEGRDVYIHCAHGHGRSATVMSALLIALGEASSGEEAVAIQK